VSDEIIRKYDALADSYSAEGYANAELYYARRARLVIAHGPRLEQGASLLDIACGDGGLGRHLLALGIDYHGVDGSPRMVDVARRSLGDRVQVATFDFVPSERVDATTIFRSLYLVPDRRAFLAGVREFTTTKLVFDFDPRAVAAEPLLDDLEHAGWKRIELRPFLTPQRGRLPRPLQAALHRIEPFKAARLLTRVRFPLLVSASE
jgi:SAM-dependent methyltransferase